MLAYISIRDCFVLRIVAVNINFEQNCNACNRPKRSIDMMRANHPKHIVHMKSVVVFKCNIHSDSNVS